jgi:hypothetical protein
MTAVICALVLATPACSGPTDWQSYVPAEVWEHYDVEKFAQSRLQHYMDLAQANERGLAGSYQHYIPNHYRKNTPVPYMPGAGQPLIDRETPVGRSLLIGP